MEKEQLKTRVLDYYRIKTEWISESEREELEKIKTEELVLATSYTEAEEVAYAIAEAQERAKYGKINFEITKTKINDVLFNDVLAQDKELTQGLVCNYFEESDESGVGLYMAKVIFFTVDEKTAKTKRTTETFFVPATSNVDATQRIEQHLHHNMGDFVIRDTRFDKAEAIYWPVDIYQNKVNSADKI